jgi:oligoribonuclease NrnB/cAMP/cGMP phosphodiesterase (DHH superfamily)
MRNFVFYHDHCTDGFGAAYAAWLKFQEQAEYIPVSYGQCRTISDVINLPKNAPTDDAVFYILDFSFPLDVMHELFERAHRVVWLDHHKTAFEMMNSDPAEVYRVCDPEQDIILDNSMSGAMLAWCYFHGGTNIPLLIQHIDDRDRWQFKMDGSKEVHAALQSGRPWTFEQWHQLMVETEEPDHRNLNAFKRAGKAILAAQDRNVETMTQQAMSCTINDAKGLAVNAMMHMSEVGHALANKSGTYGLIWYLGQDGRAKCSLRSNGGYDVSSMAKVFGGGGHLNAAGFETDIQTVLGWLK